MLNRLKERGQSIIEAVVALAIGAMIIAGAVTAMSVTLRSGTNTFAATTAVSLLSEYVDRMKALKDSDWNSLYNLSQKGSSQNYQISNSLVISTGQETPINLNNGTYTRYLYVQNVCRENGYNGEINEGKITGTTDSSGSSTACLSTPETDSNDSWTQLVTFKTTWGNNTLTIAQYLTKLR